ncbi:arabinofuranan 3-O-arabinosyltransferase [Actinoplanes lutulentus]|nr:alpha-(1->3)-arabinofuranosyltransferase [Actinoplanes lutulentus]MBB2941185.1 arabinofuranan 3-O-arabinosyltransferase [Actinoplanes lutulentus]
MGGVDQRSIWRMRLVAVCLGLAALGFLQDPGQIVIDTKVDLAVDPAGWLARALHVWDPAGTFGQLQNQAYGYLWPMGSFFLAGKVIGLPAWVIQRLWWAVVMAVACTGVVKLAEKLNIGSPWTRLFAGVAFALSPRMITELGPISVEAWPSAIAPWVLIPLVGLATGAPLLRAVTRSALMVACAGGVNATAVLAVVPLAGIWLLGLRPFSLRIKAVVAWGIAVACATAWWVVPLLLLGRYSPPFLDYIETGAVTTSTTDTVTVLRGASHWHAYLSSSFGAPWTAGWRLATEQPLVIATLVVAGLGIAGLARRGMPHRGFLITGLLVGLAMVGLGHVGAVSGLFAEAQRVFLDGAGAPLRNVHKFDVVVRLPLILGMAHLLTVFARAAAAAPAPQFRNQIRPAQLRAVVVAGVALIAVGGVAAPALGGGLAAQGSFQSVPQYWQQASGWLNRNLDQEHVLVVPGTRFPRYLWGNPSDEITQPLLDKRWGVRSSIPLTPPETIRVLDSIEQTLTSGAGSAGLADFLARSGVRYLLLRSDLDYGRSGATQPVIVKQALARSPGLRQVAGFGPYIGGGHLPGLYVDNGLNTKVRTLEVWEVQAEVEPVVAYDSSQITTVVGGPESILSASAAGALPAGPAVLAGDRTEDTANGPVVLTDGLRRKEVAFGLSHDSASATMQATDQQILDVPARDYLPSWSEGNETVARYSGITSVTAASAYSQAQPLTGSRPAYQPFAALDGDRETSWRSAPGTIATEQWFEVKLPSQRRVEQIGLTFDLGSDSVPTRITVASGQNLPVTQDVSGTSVVVELEPTQLTDRIRISFDAVRDVRIGFGGVGIAELNIPGVKAERTLVVPDSPVAGVAPSMVYSLATAIPACYFDNGRPICNGDLARGSEDGTRIDRTTTLPVDAQYNLKLTARPRAGSALNELMNAGGKASIAKDITPTVTTSSVGVLEPATRPGVVADGDPDTAWYASDGDTKPWLRMTWPAVRQINGIQLTTTEATAAARPWQVTVLGDHDVRDGFLDAGGTLVFDPPMKTDELTVLITDTAPANSYDPYRNVQRTLPVAVGEFTALPDKAPERASQTTKLDLGCGSGPKVTVEGVVRNTAMIASRRDLLELREVETRLCGDTARTPIPVSAGVTRVVAAASAVSVPSQVILTPVKATSASGGQAGGSPVVDDTVASAATGVRTPLTIESWSATQRRVVLDAYPNQRVLALRENVNTGWAASIDGEDLPTIVVDGWQQAWLVPAGASGEVVMRFDPDRLYGAAISGGALLLTGVTVVAILAGRGRPSGGLPIMVAAARRRRGVLLPALFGGAALVVFGGFAAIGLALIGAAAVLVFRVLRPYFGEHDRRRLSRTSVLAGWLLPVVLFAAAGYYAVTLGGHTAALPQLTAVAAAVLLWLSVILRRGRGQRWLKR